MTKKYSVIGIGNAIVDALTKVDETFLESSHYHKGSMTLIDDKEAPKLANLQYEKISSGGSVANSVATIAGLGLKTAFIGKVSAGHYGDIFCDDLAKSNVDFYCKNKGVPGTTAKSFIMITPDGQRTMRTFLGNASNIVDEIDEAAIANSEVLYVEGYLWDKKDIIQSIKEAIKIAKKHNNLIAFSLSDGFCVKRHRNDFLELIKKTNIVFSNESEIESLLEVESVDLNQVRDLVKSNPNLILVMTQGEKGAVIFDGKNGGNFIKIPSENIVEIIDSTGAGDSFAAGFLYGLSKQYDLKKSAEIGNLIASKVIQKIGARLDREELEKLNIK
jgi:sugar/nucleoside kinase (ribokinase family)